MNDVVHGQKVMRVFELGDQVELLALGCGERGIDAVEQEIRRIAEEGPTQKELEDAKSYLKGSQMLALDTSSKLAQALLQYQLDKLGIDYIEKRNALVDAVTLEDAKRASKRLWGQGLLTVVVGRAPQAAAQPASAPPKAK